MFRTKVEEAAGASDCCSPQEASVGIDNLVHSRGNSVDAPAEGTSNRRGICSKRGARKRPSDFYTHAFRRYPFRFISKSYLQNQILPVELSKGSFWQQD